MYKVFLVHTFSHTQNYELGNFHTFEHLKEELVFEQDLFQS